MMYGNTPKKRLHEMKKELLNFKRKMDRQERIAEKNGYMPMQYLLEWNFANTSAYEFFADGKCYVVDCETRTFPEVDFKKIKYIRKTFANDNSEYDTLNGNLGRNGESIYTIAKKFNVTDFVGYEERD